MSRMLRHQDATPCPTGSNTISHTSLRDDVTEDLNYTTEFKAALRNAGPRRRTSIAPRPQLVATENHANEDLTRTRTESELQIEGPKPSYQLGHGLAPARRQVSHLLAHRIDEPPAKSDATASLLSEHDAPNMRKRPRRRTIYIPPDDTTVLTIHPGLQSDSTVLSAYSLQPESQRDLNAHIQDGGKVGKRGTKRASLAAAPKRVPLQPSLKPLQEIDDHQGIDVAGPGKENVPPGFAIPQKSNVRREYPPKARRVSIFQSISQECSKPPDSLDQQLQQAETRRIGAPDAADIREAMRPSIPHQMAKPLLHKDRRASMMNRRNSLYYGATWKGSSNPKPHPEISAPPTQMITAAISQEKLYKVGQYQILEEDIEKPEMFEDAWLSDQESAIRQLVNRLFETAHDKASSQKFDRRDFRCSLLRLYQNSDCALIYKRLQASLLYGALNPPKGSIADTTRLKTDIGLRQRFMAIWFDTYDLEALITAAEVVIGRNVPLCLAHKSSLPQQLEGPEKERKRFARLFVESCLLRNEDAHEEIDQGNSLWCWRRTMLRCLMMVLLLDKAKQNALFPRNLLQPSSILKSSREILADLSSLISPFLGDITRPLAHLHYQVQHTQYPLSEYKYGIQNVATDLRDGVQLTRLVELLLYPPDSLLDSRKDITIAIPTGEMLICSNNDGNSWPLSQHLKVPCLTFTQKVYNVQVALSALCSVRGVGSIIGGIRASDIVNGHREKTVTLLWGLVGKWGLESMVDFENVQKEIRRLSRRAIYDESEGADTQDVLDVGLEGVTKHIHLLKQWATTIARGQGIAVPNLTTAFSDGRIFAAIVDEYQKYLPNGCTVRRQGTGQLEAKLKEIGCSNAFASIFNRDNQGRIFDRDFTLAALAFLCSRLVGASKRGLAAAVILRAYRQSNLRQNIRRRCVLLRLAHDCQSVFATRNRIICAARVLQRQWRAYLRQKELGSTLSQRRTALERTRSEAIMKRRVTSDENLDIWLL